MGNDIPSGGVPPVAPVQPIGPLHTVKRDHKPPQEETREGVEVRDAVADVASEVIVQQGTTEQLGTYDRKGKKK